MKAQVTTPATFAPANFRSLSNLFSVASLSKRLASTDFIQSLSELFSVVLEEEVSPMQTLCLLNSVLAFTMTVFPLGISFVLRTVFLAWFGISLLQCRQAGMGR